MVRRRKSQLDKASSNSRSSSPNRRISPRRQASNLDVANAKILYHSSTRPARVYKRWIFVSIGITLIFSWIFIPYWMDVNRVPSNLSGWSEFVFESAILKAMPKNIFGDEVFGNLTSILKPFWSMELLKDGGEMPGRILKVKGAVAKYPVVMVPGITSTGLELWEGEACAKPYFRQRLWGTLTMMRFMLMDSACWMRHLKLDPITGSDPLGIKLRPALGLEAADYVLPGFWVWARLIENLAEIGYDHNNLIMAPYDWRLDVINLERRDHYFTKLKSHIELLVRTRGEKVVVLTHSLGGVVWLYFMKWVESGVRTEDVVGGGGGSKWVDKHIKSFVSIGGPFLGVPKAYSSIISGETRDTAQMGKLESFALEMLMSKRERLSIFRTWIGGFSILPKGGSAFWGSEEMGSFADIPGDNVTFGIFNLNKPDAIDSGVKTHYYPDDGRELLETFLPPSIVDHISKAYSTGSLATPKQVKLNDDVPKTWTNPLESRLPSAPNMKIYCFYGVGHETERGYEFEEVSRDQWPIELQGSSNEELKEYLRSDDASKILLRFKLDLEAADEGKRLSKGIYHVDGDGTVPTLSNGYMCAHGWPNIKHLNPSGVKVITREYDHQPSPSISELRGGPGTSDHVDIMGNHEMTMDILKIVSDFHDDLDDDDGDDGLGEVVGERIYSDIVNISKRIKLPNF